MMLINGLPAESLSARDRGLAFGDGVFRTMRCEGSAVQFLARHLRRLRHDAARLGIACPDDAVWMREIAQLAKGDCTIKLTLTRGVSARGYAVDAAATPTRIVATSPLPDYSHARQGVSVRRCDWPLSIQPGLAGIKHLNRLDQVMARREWQNPAIFDGLMLNARGEVVEGVISNLFIVRDDAIYTHPLQDCGVSGVSREVMLDILAASGIRVIEQAFDWSSLIDSECVFLCNSLAGPVPVIACDALRWQTDTRMSQWQQQWQQYAGKESVQCLA
ncbi:aminodeoxychorismate lyase [Burkholderiaceae bacterium DAT-1]|nr:aminodeoxychorismate lyase [Burkholderiaceae bacterium DAT-1]